MPAKPQAQRDGAEDGARHGPDGANDAPEDTASPPALAGRYELVELIGTGGMAEVWRARDGESGESVAVKLLPVSAAQDESRRNRIKREARALSALDHPNIVRFHDYGETDQSGMARPFLVMELVEGPDLHRHLMENGTMSVSETHEVMRGVLGAVEAAHSSGVIHGDLKPANVLLGPDGAKVGDFGVARILDEETGNTTLAATPTFSAPEVLKGERATAAADVYSAACLAFQLLTGRPPYEGANGWEIINKHVEAEVPGVREMNKAVPPSLETVIRKGMDKDPAGRYASAAQFSAAMASAMPSETIPLAVTGGGVRAPGAPVPTEVVTRKVDDLGHVAVLGPLAGLWRSAGRAAAPLRRRVEERDRRFLLAAAAVALLVLLVVLAGRSGEPGTVLVPDVTGHTYQEAARSLTADGFTVTDVSFRPILQGEPGRVLYTIPAANTEVDRGRGIHVIAGALAQPPEAQPPPEPDPQTIAREGRDGGGPSPGRGGGRGRDRDRDDD